MFRTLKTHTLGALDQGITPATWAWGASFLLVLVALGFWIYSVLFQVPVAHPLPVIRAPEGPIRVRLQDMPDERDTFHVYKEFDAAAEHHKTRASARLKDAPRRPLPVAHLSWEGPEPTAKKVSRKTVDDIINGAE